jgi:putative addiction module component (TIGR02574 family)
VVIFIDMGNVEILEKALRLPPEERFVIVEGLLKSLDIPDLELDRIWAEEAERRLAVYRNGKLSGVPIEEVFGSK